jgi:hypothetical protein
MAILTQIVELEEELKGIQKEKEDTYKICALSGILYSVQWSFHTYVSGQPIGPICKGLGLLDP